MALFNKCYSTNASRKLSTCYISFALSALGSSWVGALVLLGWVHWFFLGGCIGSSWVGALVLLGCAALPLKSVYY